MKYQKVGSTEVFITCAIVMALAPLFSSALRKVRLYARNRTVEASRWKRVSSSEVRRARLLSIVLRIWRSVFSFDCW